MIRDPYYRAIIQGLDGKIDPDVFEKCAADILRDVYPGLVPIPGGQDAGMDGAIADGRGEAFPLITTTQKNVIGNLTKNLKSYLNKGGKRRKAVLATSQALTPRRVDNLHNRADELGFVLIGVHQREDIANRLYRHPEWTKELLGISGKPPALSIFPISDRPLINTRLVGRESDLKWLEETDDDLLIVGEPGSGKTFLLYQFAQHDNGLFVVGEDLGEIANNIRSAEACTLIVDDAHTKIDLLRNLVHLRQEIGAEFAILASCWPGEQDRIIQVLQIHGLATHKLDLLDRSQIVEVIKDVGIHGPDNLIREIVNQAEGRPGLAVTLAHVCMTSSVRELILGDVLRHSVRSFFVPTLGKKVVAILAVFSVGGDAGMPKEVVARELGISLADLWSTVIHLHTGGIVFQEHTGCLSVYPRALRHALVRDVFFQEPGSFLNIGPYISQAPSLWDVTDTLIGTSARGGEVPVPLLWDLLAGMDSDELWQKFAWLGRNQVVRVLNQLPDKVSIVAQSALFHVPQESLPLLFKAAVGDNRPLHSATDHPMRIIQDWIYSTRPGSGLAIPRRKILLEAACRWLGDGSDTRIGFQSLQIALSPRYMDSSIDPGNELKITLRFGCLTEEEIAELQDLWPLAFEQLGSMEIADWDQICRLVEEWVYPGRVNAPLPDDTYRIMREFGKALVKDVITLANRRPGVLKWARQIIFDADLDIEVLGDPDFEVLYPIENRTDWKAAEAQNGARSRELALAWSHYAPDDIASRLVRFEREAIAANVGYPRYSPMVCDMIADQVASPLSWGKAMKQAGAAGDLILPFLEKAIEMNEDEWISLAYECMEDPATEWVTLSALLKLDQLLDGLLDRVFQRLPDYTELVRLMCLRGQVSVKMVQRLLQHSDIEVASAAAGGEWSCDPKGDVREELTDDWRQVVISTDRDDFWLKEVLKNDPQLAFDWLLRQVSSHNSDIMLYHDEIINVVASGLNQDHRETILNIMSGGWEYTKLVQELVGDDLNLYQILLARTELEQLHLAPLVGYPDVGNWTERAIMALDHGYPPDQVALAVYGVEIRMISWSGDESKFWEKWADRFTALQAHSDERIRYIGEIGQDIVGKNQKRAFEEERMEEIYGFQDPRGHWSHVHR